MDVLPTPEAEEAEGLKILNIRCNCRRIFVFLKSPLFEKVFADNFIYCSYETYMKMLENLSWVSIPLKRHRNTSGCATAVGYSDVGKL